MRTSMSKKRKYVPSKKFNPIALSKKMEKLNATYDDISRALTSLTKSHDDHIAYLGNFARHDIKNALQSMDSILSTTSPHEFDEEKILSLQSHLNVIREINANFAKLVPYSNNGSFTLNTLMAASELLSRGDLFKDGIDFKFEYDRTSGVEIILPFQAILQVVHNLILNAIKSTQNSEVKILKVESFIDSNNLYIKIYDTGCMIPIEDSDKIFNFGYSTTGGSGIGLYHAKFLCEKFNGKVSVDLTPDSIYTKTFSLELPINLEGGEDSINN